MLHGRFNKSCSVCTFIRIECVEHEIIEYVYSGVGKVGICGLFRGNKNMWTLLPLRYRRHIFAGNGQSGSAGRSFSSIIMVFSIAGWPGCAYRGVRFVADLKGTATRHCRISWQPLVCHGRHTRYHRRGKRRPGARTEIPATYRTKCRAAFVKIVFLVRFFYAFFTW